MLTRRHFLKLTSVAMVTPILSSCFNWHKQMWFASCCTDKKGNHYAAAFDQLGNIINTVLLPERGHQIISVNKKFGRAYVCARRPESYLIEVDFTTGEILNQVSAQSGQHLYGHGCMSLDGRYLYTSENDYEAGIGLVVIRDSETLRPLEQYNSGGIGPHEIKFMPDGLELVVANGGILTHPSQPRKKLNLDTMAPNLSYLNVSNGQVNSKHTLDDPLLSIRHLDISDAGKVVVGMQYQGNKMKVVPLIASQKGQGALSYLSGSNSLWRKLNHYTASVKIDKVNNLVGVTCPRANLLTYWDLTNNTFVSSQRISDGAGIAYAGDHFTVSNGKGEIFSASNPNKPQLLNQLSQFKWDNHLSTLS